jgi:bifunctional non-homologous end joining protein LigD
MIDRCRDQELVATRKLSVYRKKRDFRKTSEPSGTRTVARAARLRFVIQKHAATRLHYDLRLELAGVFKSWAVTRQPSFDTRVKPAQMLRSGELRFRLDGSRLKGGWILVRMRESDPKRHNWLLIKHPDAYAQGAQAPRVHALQTQRTQVRPRRP